jgi:hypothetical protein
MSPRISWLFGLTIATVALSPLGFGLRSLAPVRGKRPSYVITFLELTQTIAAYESFVSARVDKFALGGFAFCLVWHERRYYVTSILQSNRWLSCSDLNRREKINQHWRGEIFTLRPPVSLHLQSARASHSISCIVPRSFSKEFGILEQTPKDSPALLLLAFFWLKFTRSQTLRGRPLPTSLYRVRLSPRLR